METKDKLDDDYYGSENEEFSDVMRKPEWPRNSDKVDYFARPETQSVVMKCETHGYPQPNVTWYNDKKKLAPISEKVMMSKWELKIKDLTMLDRGNYTCIVQNELGALNWTYKLEVTQHLQVAPMLEDIKNQTVVEGDNVTFTCVILMSDSQPLLQWLRHYKVNDSFVNDDGEPHVHVLQQSGFKKTIDDPQYLNLTAVTKDATGWYTCLVADLIGMNYQSAYLKVLTSCLDRKGNTVDYGEEYTPMGQDPCTVCMCEKSDPMTCSIHRCDLPKCFHYVWLNDTCCEYSCIEVEETVDLMVQQVRHSSAIIQWNLTDGVSLKKFEVQYTVSDFMDTDSVETVRVTSGNDFALVTSLDSNKAYMIKATGMTLDGDSVQSNVVHFKLIPKSSNSLVLVPGKHDVILQSIPTHSGKKLERIVHVNLANYDIVDHCIPEKELEGCDTMNFKRYVPHPKKVGKMRLVTVMKLKFLDKMFDPWGMT